MSEDSLENKMVEYEANDLSAGVIVEERPLQQAVRDILKFTQNLSLLELQQIMTSITPSTIS